MSAINPLDFFSPMEIEEFLEIFELFDSDGGGSIDVDELRPVLSTLGKRPSDEELEKLVGEIDADNSGEIEFDEFLLMLIYIEEDNGGHTKSQLQQYFNLIDPEQKGFIALEDISDLFTKLSTMGCVFLDPLEKDPDASVKDRAVKWDDYYNRILMAHAHGIKAKENLPTSKTFCDLVEKLEI
ncbi:hypothetical protein TL16_g06755 [Triparma laevis f. inornata]|uniref:Calmodulin n=2 Tax=Triparma laevis TaxID=1534972 RepID=A0A9W7CBK8_9STRA|nr:hypothetical protein TL16_g06755 [Triparma laevis f. inornata]GMI06785.1 hypothetical protein TrLO_g8061 [Triparma laevis f. longispina]